MIRPPTQLLRTPRRILALLALIWTYELLLDHFLVNDPSTVDARVLWIHANQLNYLPRDLTVYAFHANRAVDCWDEVAHANVAQCDSGMMLIDAT